MNNYEIADNYFGLKSVVMLLPIKGYINNVPWYIHNAPWYINNVPWYVSPWTWYENGPLPTGNTNSSYLTNNSV